MRVRIDGRVHELDACRKSTPRRNTPSRRWWTDCASAPDAAQRLAESLETALKLSGGTARLAPYDAEKPSKAADETLFSSRQACPECGYSVAALEPKMFSFNSPAGACPTCDGHRVSRISSILLRVVAYPHLSLAGGAIKSWDRKNSYYFALITAMAKHYKFDPETPWEELSKKAQQVMLFGSGNDEVEFRYVHGNGRTTKKKHRFEGIIPNLERRYKETDSLPVREELAKYLGSQPCPDCHGTRLEPHGAQCVRRHAQPARDRASHGRRREDRCSARSTSRAGARKWPTRSSRKSATA